MYNKLVNKNENAKLKFNTKPIEVKCVALYNENICFAIQKASGCVCVCDHVRRGHSR